MSAVPTLSAPSVPPRPHAAVWVEIPALDLERASHFYEAIFATELPRRPVDGIMQTLLPFREGGAGGAIVQGPDRVPSTTGTRIFLTCDQGLETVLDRVEVAGGKRDGEIVTLPPGVGRYALILDSEGNRVGLHERG